MNYFRSTSRSRRRGLSMPEMVVACAIAVATLTGITQIMYRVKSQYQALSARNIAALEATNLMEDLMSRPWAEIAAAEPPVVDLSAACRHATPNADLQVSIAEEGDDGRRITIQISWTAAGNTKVAPVRLVAWRYRPT